MIADKFITKARNKFLETCARYFLRKPFKLLHKTPLISFSFDDFPISAYEIGGAILNKYGYRGTYYISFSMLGNDSPSGPIAGRKEIENILNEGHELGCHTYLHNDALRTKPDLYESSIIKNSNMLKTLLPNARFKSFAYPYGNVTVGTKKIISKYFLCGRGVGHGQTFNKGVIDFNNLEGFFLDRRMGIHFSAIKEIIDMNFNYPGWLIFATHDISNDPSPYGCDTKLFEQIVEYITMNKMIVLPVADAYQFLIKG